MLLRAFALLAPLLEVEWTAPADCPEQDVFVERVAEEADQQVDDADEPVLRAVVVIEELVEGRWKLSLDVEGAERRQFEGDTCAAVVEAAVVVVAVRVVALVSEESSVPEPPAPAVPEAPDGEVDTTQPDAEPVPAPAEPESEPEPEPEPEENPPISSRPPPRRREGVGGWFALQGGVALGVLPGVGGAVGLEGGVRGKWWRAGLAVHGAPLRRRDHPQDATVRGRFDLVSAEALGCGVPEAGPVVFPLCGRVALGAVRGIGEGEVESPQPRTSFWGGLGGSAGAAWRVTRSIAPFVSAEVLATLRDTSFSIGTLPGAVHETGAVAFRAWLGIEFHL